MSAIVGEPTLSDLGFEELDVEGAIVSLDMPIPDDEVKKKRKRKRNRKRVGRPNSQTDESSPDFFDDSDDDPLEDIPSELSNEEEWEVEEDAIVPTVKAHGTSKSAAPSIVTHEEPTYSLFPGTPPGTLRNLQFHSSQFFPIPPTQVQPQINEEKVTRLGLIGAMVNLAHEEGLIRRLAQITEPELWSWEGNESVDILKLYIQNILTGALESQYSEGRIISPPKTTTFKDLKSSVAKSYTGDRLAVNMALTHRTENTFLYAIIERKSAVNEPSRSELMNSLLPPRIKSKLTREIELKEWMEIRDFVTWPRAIEEYSFDPHSKPRTVRFTDNLAELVFDTGM